MAEITRIGPAGAMPSGERPDAHGQAALMLAESILHALVDAGIFTSEDAVAIVGVAQDAKEEAGKDSREASDRVAQSLHLLGQIATSFGSDLQ